MTSPGSLRLSLIALPGDADSPADQTFARGRAAKRSDQAVNAPWEDHLDVVYRYALKLTRDPQQASDLAQEAMLRGWRGRAALREPAAARVWLLRIATNLWTDRLRSKGHEPQRLTEPPPSRGPSIARQLIHQEQVTMALAAIDELPPRQRQVVHLVTVEQMSHDEVAAVLGISPAAVKANLAAGRKELRERLRVVYEDVCGVKRCRTNE